MNDLSIPGSIHTARQTGAKRKPGKVAGTTTKAGEIEIDGIWYPLNGGGNRSPLHVDWMTRAIRHIAAKLEGFGGKALIVRIDLHHPESQERNDRMTAFIEAMSKAIKREYGHKLGYVWAREQETAKAHHYHLALVLDGDRVQQGIAINKLAAKIWGKMGGTLGRCDDYWQMVGRGGVTLPEVSFWLSYLTKIRGKGSAYRADYAQDFSTGRETTKARPKKKGQIVKVIPVRGGHLLAFVRTRAGLTSAEVRELGMVEQAGKLWLKWRAVSRVAVALNVDDRTAERWIMEALPGQLENHKALRAARLGSAKAKGLELVRAGEPVAHAAAAVGVDDMTLWYWLERDGEQGPAVQAARAEKASKRELGVAMLRDGASNAEVRAATGAPRTTVVKWRNAAGIAAPARGKALDGKRAEAIAMIEAGATTREAGEAVGVHFSTVAKWAKAAQQ